MIQLNALTWKMVVFTSVDVFHHVKKKDAETAIIHFFKDDSAIQSISILQTEDEEEFAHQAGRDEEIRDHELKLFAWFWAGRIRTYIFCFHNNYILQMKFEWYFTTEILNIFPNLFNSVQHKNVYSWIGDVCSEFLLVLHYCITL